MIQKESRLEVTDNSGAKEAMVIGVLGSSTATGRFTRLTMGIGDRVVCSVKKALPNGEVKAGDKVQAVIVRVKSPTRRDDGSYVRFDSNACVLVDKDGNPKGTTKNRPVRSAHTNVSMRTTHHTNELPKRRPPKAHA